MYSIREEGFFLKDFFFNNSIKNFLLKKTYKHTDNYNRRSVNRNFNFVKEIKISFSIEYLFNKKKKTKFTKIIYLTK